MIDNSSACDLLRLEIWPNWSSPGLEQYVPPSTRPSGAAFDWFEFWFGLVMVLLGLGLFVFVKLNPWDQVGPHRKRAEVRPLVPVVVSHIGGILALLAGPLSFLLDPNEYPCFIISLLHCLPRTVCSVNTKH